MSLRVVLKLALSAAIMLSAASTQAQKDAGCITAECHEKIGTKKWVHGPVGAGICTICHTEVAGKKHEFTFVEEKEELCFGCHEAKRDMMLEDNLHTPVANGNCVGCHDPHQSDHRFTLKGLAADLCYQCHKKEKFLDKFVHGPIGVGDCNACHNPHASANEFQLVTPRKELCFNCHKEKLEMMAKRHVHPPVGDNCTNCHSPHASAARYQLASSPPDLCYSCHPAIDTATSASHRHPPAADGECYKCHNSHASDNPNMFILPQKDLCFSCHKEMSEYVTAHEYRHGPVKQGDCNACHNPHGSENHRLLRKNFPEEFYMPYAEDNYAICFDCHNRNIATDEKTKTLTDFRDGDINLHFKHVNKDVKGRSCKACHQVHASDQKKHIRESVPFGSMKWELPITYTKTEDGGRCVVGCHAPKEYSRK